MKDYKSYILLHRTNTENTVSVLQSLYETWFIAFYTTFYTSVQIFFVAIFEKVRELAFFSPTFLSNTNNNTILIQYDGSV